MSFIQRFFTRLSEKEKKAFTLILFFGVISLLGDVIYEGARSVNGPYLSILGANAFIIGVVVGIGEFLGYGIRLISGYASDKFQAHWLFTIVGYSLLIFVPLLAISNTWGLASVFIILERIGKGIRSPARDTIVSFAAKQVGTGYGFGISEFLDQVGALLGPLVFTSFFLLFGATEKILKDYQNGYSLLWIPFLLLFIILYFTFLKFQTPTTLEETGYNKEPLQIPKIFWWYSLFAFFTTFGFISFAIVGYHLKINKIASDSQIPFLYSIAMIVDAIASLVIGKLYDWLKIKYKSKDAGLFVLLPIPIVSIMTLVFMFSSNLELIFIGVVLWGMVMGLHETIMKAVVADLTSVAKRGIGYGIFSIVYGFGLFFGNISAGYLYEVSISFMIFVLLCTEIVATILFFVLKKFVEVKPL